MSIDSVSFHPPLEGELDDYVGRPFFEQTLTLLRGVRDNDFTARRTETGCEHWFRALFAQFDVLGADTDSEILDYVSIEGASLGYSVLDFRQYLTVDDRTATFDCLATITWRRTTAGWRQAHWHGSVISSNVPEGFGERT